jgi:hypothetical protein
MLDQQGPIDAVLDRHRWGYYLRSSDHENSPLSSFPSDILQFPLVAPPGLILCHNPKVKAVNHIGPPSIERALL